MSIFTWGVQSLVSTKPEDPKPERYNPRPPGVIREGSATAAVLAFLLAHRGKRFAAYQVIHATGCTQKATSWALVYLQQQGLIETSPDPRNERYLRYGSNEKTTSAQISEPRTTKGSKGLERNGQQVYEQPAQRLEVLRGQGDTCQPRVDRELSPVSTRHGIAANAQALAGQKGHQRALHPRQLPLDNERGTDVQAGVLPPGSCGWPGNDREGGEQAPRNADAQRRDSTVDLRPEAQGQRRDVQIHAMADVSGRDHAADSVGKTDWRDASQDSSAPSKRYADGQSVEPHEVA